MFTPYGFATMRKVFALSLLCIVAAIFSPLAFSIILVLLAALSILFTLYFFRDPERKAPLDAGAILAPADGKILLVCPHDASSTLVSIFMSPFNVHVNRIPIDGEVKRLTYHPGKFMMAFDHRSMESNEKMEIEIESGDIRVIFSQVSGFLARRIVCDLKEGELVKAGSRFGMIRFGSRVDLILPARAKVQVKVGDITKAGETVIARC
ncbi:MAG: phosphatidylserine decarboxylase [Chlorobiaceae bacterium]